MWKRMGAYASGLSQPGLEKDSLEYQLQEGHKRARPPKMKTQEKGEEE